MNASSVVFSDELDSYMYQTVGHHAVDLYAQAMDLPLYQRIIQGSSVEQGQVYSVHKDDEVEDLYELLKQIKVSTCTLSNLCLYTSVNQYVHY